jgi:uncharacterized protein YacL (UPF0231 family)
MLMNALEFIDSLDDKLRAGQRHGLWMDDEEYMVRLTYDGTQSASLG